MDKRVQAVQSKDREHTHTHTLTHIKEVSGCTDVSPPLGSIVGNHIGQTRVYIYIYVYVHVYICVYIYVCIVSPIMLVFDAMFKIVLLFLYIFI